MAMPLQAHYWPLGILLVLDLTQLAEATTQAIAIYETVKVKLASDLVIKTKHLSAIG